MSKIISGLTKYLLLLFSNSDMRDMICIYERTDICYRDAGLSTRRICITTGVNRW